MSEEKWLAVCRHGNSERECDKCYDWARAESETMEHGTWRPPTRDYKTKSFRLYKSGDLHRVDSILDQLTDVFGDIPRTRVKLKG